MTDQHDAESLANLSADLTAIIDARAQVRIDAAERDPNTVGFALGRYRVRAGLTEQELADWLGITLPILADLAIEMQPLVGGQAMGVEQIAEVYGADRERLKEGFERGEA